MWTENLVPKLLFFNPKPGVQPFSFKRSYLSFSMQKNFQMLIYLRPLLLRLSSSSLNDSSFNFSLTSELKTPFKKKSFYRVLSFVRSFYSRTKTRSLSNLSRQWLFKVKSTDHSFMVHHSPTIGPRDVFWIPKYVGIWLKHYKVL